MRLILYKRRKNISFFVFLKTLRGSLRGKGKAKTYFQKVWLLESLVALIETQLKQAKEEWICYEEWDCLTEPEGSDVAGPLTVDSTRFPSSRGKSEEALHPGSPLPSSSLPLYLFSKPWGKYSPSTAPSLEFKTVEIFDQQISVKLLLAVGSQ